MSDKVTARPWKWFDADKVRVHAQGFAICQMTGGEITRDKTNAAHIVKCVNYHEQLVEALRDCEEVLAYVARKSGLTHSDAEGVAIEARNLLEELENPVA